MRPLGVTILRWALLRRTRSPAEKAWAWRLRLACIAMRPLYLDIVVCIRARVPWSCAARLVAVVAPMTPRASATP